ALRCPGGRLRDERAALGRDTGLPPGPAPRSLRAGQSARREGRQYQALHGPLVGELTEIIVRRRQECTYTTVAGETAESRYIFHRYGDRRLPQGVDRCLRRGRVRETEGAPRRASSGRSQGQARHEGDADLPRAAAT